MNRPIILFALLVICTWSVEAQPEFFEWEAVQPNYLIPADEESRAKIDGSTPVSFLFTGLAVVYQRTFSDYDGDNCPFHPSCSNFFIQSVEQTNIFFGLLSFSDRFTRDSNLLKSRDKYPLHKNGKFYDPAHNYTLDVSKIGIYRTGTPHLN